MAGTAFRVSSAGDSSGSRTATVGSGELLRIIIGIGADTLIELAGSEATAGFALLGGGKLWGGLTAIETAVRGAIIAGCLTALLRAMEGASFGLTSAFRIELEGFAVAGAGSATGLR